MVDFTFSSVFSLPAQCRRFFSFVLLFFLVLVVGCVDFTAYSDANEVVAVRAGVLSSDEVYVDKQEILSAEEGRIVLKIKGNLEENIPLTVDAEFELSPEAKILYAEKYRQFVFHSVQDSFSFQVIAQSGLPKKWIVKLEDARNADNDILRFEIASYQANTGLEDMIGETAGVYRLKDTSLIQIFVNAHTDSVFPIEIVPNIQVSEKGHLIDYEEGKVFRFESLKQEYLLKVEAENKTIKHWKVTLRTPDSDDVNLKGGSFIVFSDCLEVADTVFQIDTAHADALVKVQEVKDWKNFNVQLQYGLKLPLGAKFVLLDGETEDFNAQKVIFNQIQEIRKFKIVSQSGREKLWKIRLEYAYEDKATIENFSYSSYRPQELVDLSLGANVIDTVRSKIFIDVNTGVKNISEATPLYLLPVFKLSSKATMEGIEADQAGVFRLPEIAFTSIKETYRFSIYSESLREYEWEIVLVDRQSEKDSTAEVKNIVLHTDRLPEQVVFTDNIYTANAERREIVLKLQSVKFPFMLEAGTYTVNIAGKAQLLEADKTLVFEKVSDQKTVRVEAENGSEKVWTIRLDYARNTDAEIKSLKIVQVFPDQVSFERNGIIDVENRVITLQVTDANAYFPLRMDVEPEVSPKAHMEPEIRNIVFADENSVVHTHIIAESGADREWTIRLQNRTVKNDEAVIQNFVVESIQPEIEIGKTVMQGNNIQVEILKGKNQFPLSLDIDKSVFSEGATASKVILTFETINRNEVFIVTSQSGKVSNRYTVSLVDRVPLSDSAQITALQLERYQPYDYKLPGSVEIGENEIFIDVYGELTVPLVVWPVLTFSEGAVLKTTLPGEGLTFASFDERKAVTVVSESGKVKEWKIGLRQLELPKNNGAVIEQVEASNSSNIVIEPVIKENNHVVLYLADAKPTYPFTVQTVLSVSPNAQVRLMHRTVERTFRKTRAAAVPEIVQVLNLTFNNASDQIEVQVISEDGTKENAYNFQLGGEKIKNTEANVLEYKIESYFPMNMSEAPIIFDPDTAAATITVNAPGENDFPFTLYTKMRLSYGAEIVGLNASQMTFERGFQEREFQVKAESGTVKNWRLVMKVAEKSKENNITDFEIQEYSPLTAGLGKPEIRTADRTISIPVKEWIKGERLTLSAAIQISPKATTDFRTTLFFQTAKDEYRFNVTAQNGEVAEWKVVLDYTFSNQANITSFAVTSGEPASVLYEPQGVIDVVNNVVYIDVLENLTFPFTVNVDLGFSPKTEVDMNGMSGNRIRFDRYQDSTTIRIMAEDEVTRKDWRIKLRYHFSEEAEITAFTIAAFQPSGVLLGSPAVNIEPATHTVWVNVADWQGLTSLQITPALEISDKATHNLTGDLLFVKKTSETKTIQVMAESGKMVPWSVKLRYEESSEAEIVEVKYTVHEPSDINFIGATIDPKTATVILELQTWNGHTEFTLKGIACVFSAKAAASIPSEMTFRKQIQESFEYPVKAQDGTEKKWRFTLLYHESNAAEITRFQITGSNRPGVITMATTGKMGDGVIDIELYSGVRDAFASGFQVNVEVATSAKSTHNIPSVLSFSKVSDVRKYTVTAESGAKKEWTIRFQNKASQEANLLAFQGATIVGGTTSDRGDFKFIDVQFSGNVLSFTLTDIISKNKYNSQWPTLDINLDVQLSPRAIIKEGNQVSIQVSNPGRKTLTVLADDGVNQQTYYLDVVYKPQLENWQLDNWNDNKTPAGSVWGTANNTFVSGTSKTSGKSGSGALMQTSEAMGMKAAGTIFLGMFKFTSLTDALNDPEKMTYFGIPFPARPRQLKVDVQYKQGNGTLNDGSRDKGQVWIALEYWPDPNNAKNTNNKRYAYGELILDQNVGSWTTYTIHLNVTDASVVPTHLLVVASSSMYGNYFNAVVGSEMRLDNVELVY